jgi:hypothetical protein
MKQFLLKSNKKEKFLILFKDFNQNFFHIVMRRGGLKNVVTTGKIEGKRDRGRKCEKMLDSLIVWNGVRSTEDMFSCVAHRGLWRDMTAYAIRHGT